MPADSLELPEGHYADSSGYLPLQSFPRFRLSPELGQSSVRLTRLGDGCNYRRLPAGILLEDRTGSSPTCRMIRGGLPPVIRDEPFCQLVGSDVEPAAGVVASLDADVGDRQEKCVLVSGDETALPQQPLEVEKETYLSFGGRRAGRSYFPG